MANVEQQIKNVEKFFDGYAADFDSIYGHSRKRNSFEKWIDRTFRKSMTRRLELTLGFTEKNPNIKSVIDIGCGPGHFVVGTLNQGKKVVALDIADGMLKICKNLIDESKLTNKDVEFVLSDYLKYQPKQNFDAAIMMGFMEYIPEPVVLLKKLKKEINEEIYMSLPKKGGLLGAQRKFRYNLRNCPLWMYNKQEVEKMMADAGFDKDHYQIIDCDRDFFVRMLIKK